MSSGPSPKSRLSAQMRVFAEQRNSLSRRDPSHHVPGHQNPWAEAHTDLLLV